MINIKQKGDFSKTYRFLDNASKSDIYSKLEKYGEIGVRALSYATPIDTGKTASSWSYEIKRNKSSVTISWNNSNIENGVPIVLLIQYGHATKNGGFVQGRDFINPAIKPIFDDIANSAWQEVVK